MVNRFEFRQPIESIFVSSTQELPLVLQDVKNHLRVDFAEDDAYITNLIKTAALRFEKITGRDLITKTYKSFIDIFPVYNIPIILPRSKIQSVISIQYFLNDVATTYTASNYYFTESNNLSAIYLKEDKQYPTEIDYKKNCIVINYTSGFGATNTSVPFDIKQMLYEYIAFLYKNRGDTCCNDMNIAINSFISQIVDPL